MAPNYYTSPQKSSHIKRRSKTIKSNFHPFINAEKENFPNIEDAFKEKSSSDKTRISKISGRTLPEQPESSILFALSPHKNSKHNFDYEKDRSICSFASTIYDDVSVNLSIGARAALAEHRHYVANHGIDDEFGTSNKAEHVSSFLQRSEDDEWDRIMEGNSFYDSPAVYDSINYGGGEKIDSCIQHSKCASVVRSVCDTSDFFNSSRVHGLYTPEKNKPRVDEASRLARLGEGGVTRRSFDYIDESQINDSECASAELDESYLVEMLKSAARINNNSTLSSPSQVTQTSFQVTTNWENVGYQSGEFENKERHASPHSRLFNDDSFRGHLDWENEAESDIFNKSQINDENVMPDGAFSEIGASFLDHKESSFLKEESDFILKQNNNSVMTPISKRHTSSYFETPLVSPKRGSPSQYNYLGISPMQNVLNSSVLGDDGVAPTSLVVPFIANESFVEDNDAPALFNDSSPVSSIIKKSSSSEHQKSSSISRDVSFSQDTKGESFSSSKQNNSLRVFNPNNSRAVCYEYGVEIFDSLPIKPIHENNAENDEQIQFNHSKYSNKLNRKQQNLFTPETETASLSPSIDFGGYTNEEDINSAQEYKFTRSSRKSDAPRIKPKSLLESFETNLNKPLNQYRSLDF